MIYGLLLILSFFFPFKQQEAQANELKTSKMKFDSLILKKLERLELKADSVLKSNKAMEAKWRKKQAKK